MVASRQDTDTLQPRAPHTAPTAPALTAARHNSCLCAFQLSRGHYLRPAKCFDDCWYASATTRRTPYSARLCRPPPGAAAAVGACRLLLLLAAVGAANAAWTDCSSGHSAFKVSSVTLEPSPVKPGDTAQFSIKAESGEAQCAQQAVPPAARTAHRHKQGWVASWMGWVAEEDANLHQHGSRRQGSLQGRPLAEAAARGSEARQQVFFAQAGAPCRALGGLNPGGGAARRPRPGFCARRLGQGAWRHHHPRCFL